ncbi:MAG: carboxylating nicotinate-nucleotide diphosphorylase [Oscillospiraceae bacterium]|jgi:nicotinate-nucleotide pyrophosphorylase (carboxylating)|nr:carboxylating nicotinate-nucleotide diphosphorylase [Oscillospiraceae bacterium]
MTQFLSLDAFIAAALREDVGTGDITTRCCVPEDAVSAGFFRAKERGVVAGLFILPRVFAQLDAGVVATPLVKEGAEVNSGDIVATIEGNSRAILTGERVALNILQRLSGVATQTAAAVAAVAGTKTRIVDTRKTTPGLRELEKYAVRTGGGVNHRFGLSDGILIKDNHIKASGGITAAITSARKNAPHTLKIEVEAETLEQVAEALDARADVIMLDNMTTQLMAESVKLIAGRALTEASGNMGERDLREVADTGVDFISIGGLTHSVRALDISLKF